MNILAGLLQSVLSVFLIIIYLYLVTQLQKQQKPIGLDHTCISEHWPSMTLCPDYHHSFLGPLMGPEISLWSRYRTSKPKDAGFYLIVSSLLLLGPCLWLITIITEIEYCTCVLYCLVLFSCGARCSLLNG